MSYENGGPLVQGLIVVGSCLDSTVKVPLDVYIKLLDRTPREEYGDFGFPLGRFIRGDLSSIVDNISECVSRNVDFIILTTEKGFMNIRVLEDRLGSELLNYVGKGWVIDAPKVNPNEAKRIVIEHTSANPVHPLHIGHARNASLGDSLSRMLKARGHIVIRRYYVNDVGRQMAVVALGLRILGISPNELASRLNMKIDHAIGWVYAITHTSIDYVSANNRGNINEAEKLASILAKLRERGDSKLADYIINSILSIDNPEALLSEIMARYEYGLEPEKSLIMSIAKAVIEGFNMTLSRIGVAFDYIDWESSIVWSGLVANVLEAIKQSKYITKYKDTLALDIMSIVRDKIGDDESLREVFKIPKGFDIPPMVLVRSDGTTLYWTRDIAYSIFKFRDSNADIVINVISGEQRLPQLQIRLALLGLGLAREAHNMIHYDYEIVRLPGRVMSGRRGEYVSLDEILDEAKARALQEILARNTSIDMSLAESIAEKIAVGAIRFSLAQPGALKPIVFDVEKILNFEENTGPYLQYTYARAHNILEKHGPIDYRLVDPTAYKDRERRSLLIHTLMYPLISAKAIDELRPEDIASYLLKLADIFNRWYQRDSVIHEQNIGFREAKALLVKLVRDALSSGLTLLGVPVLERM
ncbi:MAG: arginine--tRNA ligase [Acidilobaceae archaeon]